MVSPIIFVTAAALDVVGYGLAAIYFFVWTAFLVYKSSEEKRTRDRVV